MNTLLKTISGLAGIALILSACSQKNEPPADNASPSPNQSPQTVKVRQTAPNEKKDQSLITNVTIQNKPKVFKKRVLKQNEEKVESRIEARTQQNNTHTHNTHCTSYYSENSQSKK